MKKRGLQGTGSVFRFSFRQQAGKTGWLVATILPMLLLLILIPAIMLLVERGSRKPDKPTLLKYVFIGDETGVNTDYAVLNQAEDPVFSSIEYETCADLSDALQKASARSDALALEVRLAEENYELRLVRPEGTELSSGEASRFGRFLTEHFQMITVQKSGISPEVLAELGPQVVSGASTSEAYRSEKEQDGFAAVREILDIVLPYLCIMLLYFLVLFYGQGIAGSVILEKSSKLMDTMLLSLRPEAMILGKTLAGALAGILQMAAWIAGVAGGCILGKTLILSVYPDSTMGLLQFFSLLGRISGLFTWQSIVLAALLLAAGFLMYCAIASIGGALASRPEDLGSCNSIFTLLLVASLLLTIYGETGNSGSIVSDAAWMNFVPFTAVMTTPARALMGRASNLTCLISLLLTLALSLLAILLAGRLYRLLTFRRGDPPKVRDIPRLLRGS